MPRWLVKTDPRLFAWDDLVAAGTVAWAGVRNPLALHHLGRMRRGEDVLVYHSGGRSEIVGVARVVRGPYADLRARHEREVVVDLAARDPLPTPVRRSDLVALPETEDWELVTHPRLTVLPVPEAAWRVVRRLAATGNNHVRRRGTR